MRTLHSGRDGDRSEIVVVYERVSTDRQDLARQAVQRDRAIADYPDATIVLLQDDGVSAFKVPIFEREDGGRLSQMIEAGRVEAVYVDALDRITRGEDIEWVTFRVLCESRGTRIVIDGREQRNDLGGRLESYLRALIARQESEEKSHRVKGGKRTNRARGWRNGGPRPFGYRHRDRTPQGRPTGPLIPDPQEIMVLRRIREMVIVQGLSLSEIARRLNAGGIRSVRGASWSQTRLSQTLANPFYVGKVRHREDLFPGQHEPAFSEAEWAELHSVLEARRRGRGGGRGGRPTKGSHILTGDLLRCGDCGAAVVPRTTTNAQGRVYELYRCSGALSGSTPCRSRGVRRELVDGALKAYFGRAGLADLEAARRAFEEQAERDLVHVRALCSSAKKRAADKDAALERIRGDYIAGELPAADWRLFREELEAERADALAEAEQFREREAELIAAAAEVDAEEEALRTLAEFRAVLTEPIRKAETISAVRLRLAAIFDHFILSRREPEVGVGPPPSGAGGYWLRPLLREDAFDSLVATRVPAASPR
jgi:DNA invertase Pin-like site-specific DNA recombinase